jgi:hypothetical protein
MMFLGHHQQCLFYFRDQKWFKSKFVMCFTQHFTSTDVVRRLTNLIQQINPHGRSPIPSMRSGRPGINYDTRYSFSGYQQPAFADASTAYIPPRYRYTQPETTQQQYRPRTKGDWQLTQYTGSTQEFIENIVRHSDNRGTFLRKRHRNK